MALLITAFSFFILKKRLFILRRNRNGRELEKACISEKEPGVNKLETSMHITLHPGAISCEGY